MTVKELVDVLENSVVVNVVEGETTVASFEITYKASIVDEIMELEVGAVDINAAYKGSTSITVYEQSEDDGNTGDDGDGNDGDDGGNTEPDDEP